MLVGLLGVVNACASQPREGPTIQERVWPVYLGNAQRVNAAESLAADPQQVWRVQVSRGLVGAPALSEDVIAVSLVDHRVALLDRTTGVELWNRRLDQPLGAGPLLADDRVFVAEQTPGGKVYALRLNNGTTLWSARTGDTFAPLTMGDGGLFVATAEGHVGRIDPQTGSYIWRQRLHDAVRASPVVVPAGLVVATQADSLFLLDKTSGAIMVRRGTRGTVLAAPALADSQLIIGTTSGRLEGLDAASLATRWSLDMGSMVVGSVAVREHRAYAITGDGTMVIVPLASPNDARRVFVQLPSRAGPAPGARGVYLAGVNGEIVLVDTTGARLWVTRIEPPIVDAVVLDAHTLIVVSVRGEVAVYR